MSWLEAIEKVLVEAEYPMTAEEIAEQVVVRGYREAYGATPNATVGAAIYTSIKRNPDTSPFVKLSRNRFGLRSGNMEQRMNNETSAQQNYNERSHNSVMNDAPGLIKCFGMYWQRSNVNWQREPSLFGRQFESTQDIDFGKQKGVYVLYDHHTPVYVGRAIERPLGMRLNEHTRDRLAHRWSSFSWFGLLQVTGAGLLSEKPNGLNLRDIIVGLEAVLIEALEPPQNRRRGDEFDGVEYIQGDDPKLEEKRKRELVLAFMNSH